MNGETIIQSNLIVENNKIVYIGEELPIIDKIDKVIDCNGNLLMPGFKNAHTHNAMTLLRSYADDLPLHNWLFDKIFPIEAHLTDEITYYFTILGILENLSSGVTACFDFYFPLRGQIKAFKDTGMRALILLNNDLSKAELEDIFENQATDLVNYTFGMHAEYTASDETIKMIKELVKKYRVPFYTHCSETKLDIKKSLENRKMYPLEFFNSLGLFDYGGGIFHGIYLTDHELDIIKDKGLHIITCPGSNTKLASGIAPLHKYNQMGLNLAIGTDGPSSNNSLNMFKEMYLATGLQKLLNEDPSVMDAKDVLYMATVGGAKAMNLKDCDILEVGKTADIVMIDMNLPNMRPYHNIEKNLVYSGSNQNVLMTMVNGKILYEYGKFNIGFDIDKLYEKLDVLKDEILKK